MVANAQQAFIDKLMSTESDRTAVAEQQKHVAETAKQVCNAFGREYDEPKDKPAPAPSASQSTSPLKMVE